MEVNVLGHSDVPEHHLVPEKDEEGILKTLNAGKDQMPKIRKSDPCVKLLEEFHDLDIEEGRLIRIVRLNEISGVSVAYRVVVRG
jgi:DNA-directed RNA polymerase subunit H